MPNAGAHVFPGRGYPEVGAEGYVASPPVGGARGPAAIPSRTVVSPQPPPVTGRGGAHGPVHRRGRGKVVSPGRSPGVQMYGHVTGEAFHGSIAWNRPRYANAAGQQEYVPPTPMPSWSANEAVAPAHPIDPIPVSVRQITNDTVRKPYGDSSGGTFSLSSYGQPPSVPIVLPYYGLPNYPSVPQTTQRRPQSGSLLQRLRAAAQARTSSPSFNLLTAWQQAPSYGSQTPVLNTYGAY